MTKPLFPPAVFSDHTAVLGKTGSGKTSTAKLIVEAACSLSKNSRVCILDPIKSDWWGITLGTDGHRRGLGFDILRGPKAHVPLPASAGAAIAELVGSGSLSRSILDMADFGPGDLQRFFVDFAQMLLKKMRGVLYLVIEEAHEFAPKERAGFDKENMAIHYAKKLATAGRSKGIRLLVLSQRTQSLHNALLGSCETVIAHRMTQPADQEPVLKWLKANAPKDIMTEVADSLSSLKTGTGWVCSGEAAVFERREFPRIGTYDNSATPDGSDADDIRVPPIDAEKLKALLGAAVAEAQSNDPAALKKQIVDLQRKIAALGTPVGVPADPKQIERAYESGADAGFKSGSAHGWKLCEDAIRPMLHAILDRNDGVIKGLEEIVAALASQPKIPVKYHAPNSLGATLAAELQKPPSNGHARVFVGSGEGAALPRAQRLILTVLAQYPDGRSRTQVALLSGYSGKSSNFDNALGALRSGGLINRGDPILITDAGRDAVGKVEVLPSGRELQAHWLSRLPKAERALLSAAISYYPRGLSREHLAEESKYSAASSTFDNALGRLRSLELVDRGAEIRASKELFE